MGDSPEPPGKTQGKKESHSTGTKGGTQFSINYLQIQDQEQMQETGRQECKGCPLQRRKAVGFETIHHEVEGLTDPQMILSND